MGITCGPLPLLASATAYTTTTASDDDNGLKGDLEECSSEQQPNNCIPFMQLLAFFLGWPRGHGDRPSDGHTYVGAEPHMFVRTEDGRADC